MKPIPVSHEMIMFPDIPDLPPMAVQFGACRKSSDGYFFDIVDFSCKSIDRWSIASVGIEHAEKLLRRTLDPGKAPGNMDFMVKEASSVHVLQVSPQGKLFVSRGNFLNGTSFFMIDTSSREGFVMMEDDGDDPMFYSSTGGFSPDYSRWYFVRWPLAHTVAILNGISQVATCEIGTVELDTGKVEIVHTLDIDDRIHQISVSPDNRFLVFTSFKSDMRIDYPRASMAENPEAYRQCHNAGIIPKTVITFDIETGRHWETDVPVPVSAHMEFDLLDPSVFYVSGHNFSINHTPEVIIEGPGAVIKMQIQGNRTVVVDQFAPDDLFRVSQHVPFIWQGKTIIAVTNTPNKLDLVDGNTMELWRREELFPFEALDFSVMGSVVSPMPEEAFFSINPAADGKYIVLESSRCFHIYDVEAAVFLDTTMDRFLLEGAVGTGHTRVVGR